MTPPNTLWVKCYNGNFVRLRNDSWFMKARFLVIALRNVKALLVPMLGIFDVVIGIMLNNLVFEVDITKYQQVPLVPEDEKLVHYEASSEHNNMEIKVVHLS